MNSPAERIQQVLRDIDELNETDPRQIEVEGENRSYELVYGLRMTEMLRLFSPKASEHLQIAARGQHIGRWHIPRDSFPMDRPGYLKWRSKLKIYHADTLAEIMRKRSYAEADIDLVRNIVIKKGLKSDADMATLEDVVCLVFLQYYLEDFAAQHDEAKVVDILQKTWGKMTERCHEWALSMKLSPVVADLVKKAIEG